MAVTWKQTEFNVTTSDVSEYGSYGYEKRYFDKEKRPPDISTGRKYVRSSNEFVGLSLEYSVMIPLHFGSLPGPRNSDYPWSRPSIRLSQ